jgi:hypothetical protein
MLTPTERKQRIARLKELPASIESSIAGLNDAQLDATTGVAAWSIRQIVHHVADSHLVGFARMRLVLTESKPILKPYKQDAWVHLPDGMLPPQISLDILGGLHARWSTMLASLPDESWARTGVHLDNGLMTLDDLLEVYARHGDAHLAQIAETRQAIAG